MNEDPGNPMLQAISFIAFIVSLVHVCRESLRMHDGPIRHTLMIALCAWPLGYLCWVFWWPGSFRQWLFGSDQARIRRQGDRRFGSPPGIDEAPNQVDGTRA
jgi:hypothetical protein